MSTPLITNIAPVDGAVAPVGVSSRYSVRDSTTEINRSKLRLFRGSGKVMYRGGKLPEDIVSPVLTFKALSGSPGVPATRTILGDGFLQINKSVASQNQEAVYLMGGLESPAEPNAPLMLEFTLRLNKNEVTTSGQFTGVLVGLLINNSGLTVKFFTNAGVQRIELHGAGLTDNTPILTATFDWDEAVALGTGGANTYKLLWHPQLNLVKLYVKEKAASTDRLLATGTVTAFPTVPVQEQLANQPWMFFGHGNYPTQTSISEWKDVFLFNEVSVPILDGIAGGGSVTSILPNNQTYYDGTVLPRDADRPWQILPSSFGTIGGIESIMQEGLVLERTETSKSLGFYRVEPKVTTTVLDFTISGQVKQQETGKHSTGMEVYIDDGTKQARFALLQDPTNLEQYVGVLINSLLPKELSSYEAVVQGFGGEVTYRLVLITGTEAVLYRLIDSVDGMLEDLVFKVPYANLPATGMPGPGIGFLHNANSSVAKAVMTVRRVRYSTNVTSTGWEDLIKTSPTWTKVGSGTAKPASDNILLLVNKGFHASINEVAGVVTVTGLSGMTSESVGNWLEVLNGEAPGIYKITSFISSTSVQISNTTVVGPDSGNPNVEWVEIKKPAYLRLSDANVSSNLLFKREYPGLLQSDSGWTLEFRARMVSHQHTASAYATGTDPIRSSTGMMAHVLDGTFRTALVFADAGPDLGKIVFLMSKATEFDNLIAIRAGASEVVGTYAKVDWSKFHLYRLEKNEGEKLRLLIDDVKTLELDERKFAYPAHLGGGNPRVEIGHSESGILTVSDWDIIKFCLSDGFDVSSKLSVTAAKLLAMFNSGVNVIAEAEDT